jgi:hypothetical protein
MFFEIAGLAGQLNISGPIRSALRQRNYVVNVVMFPQPCRAIGASAALGLEDRQNVINGERAGRLFPGRSISGFLPRALWVVFGPLIRVGVRDSSLRFCRRMIAPPLAIIFAPMLIVVLSPNAHVLIAFFTVLLAPLFIALECSSFLLWSLIWPIGFPRFIGTPKPALFARNHDAVSLRRGEGGILVASKDAAR